MRLLEIHPADNDDEPLTGNLAPVEFGEKPQYEALSYMWGDSAALRPISINRQTIFVRKNLFDALLYLRNQRRKLRIWIDALCINQEDIAERNRQLRIMHHIYSRARTVIVWLGESYSQYNDMIKGLRTRQNEICADTTMDSLESQSQDRTTSFEIIDEREREMVGKLYNDGYWRRVWIIQEIGRADCVEVCFGRSDPMRWDLFVHLIAMHTVGDDGPIRLHQLRERRHDGSHTFKQLLKDHRQSECEEPRDKVYGLVGLAIDAQRFPMDYSKSLIDVWTDVMHFTHVKGLLPETEIIPFGSLVKHILMGKLCTPFQQVRQQYRTNCELDSTMVSNTSRNLFKVSGRIIGQVIHIGPSTVDIVGRLDAVDDWNEKVQDNFYSQVESAQFESRRLVHSILTLPKINTCSNSISIVQWVVRYSNLNYQSEYTGLKVCISSIKGFQQRESREKIAEVSDNARLFQLRNQNHTDQPWKMGIASCQTKEGDLLVWIADLKQAIVLRVQIQDDDMALLQIIGTAWVTDDVAKMNTNHSQRLEYFHSTWNSLPLQLDAPTIFQLLAQNDDVYGT